eukprot:CAMPEP_0176185824 /NCGR_PEP_ID=MMETSP0121_2-20121125/1554_1 /TAXON_ID=160619 /ORGANISM="Kryptoperidinium foliaceum, Strain CCMP 1326" /LENGTH=143 /DNA_ID=CAMNT_0017524291 /DNA_START=132 /DNA_END=560 /DNA_ORIENTATION=+
MAAKMEVGGKACRKDGKGRELTSRIQALCGLPPTTQCDIAPLLHSFMGYRRCRPTSPSFSERKRGRLVEAATLSPWRARHAPILKNSACRSTRPPPAPGIAPEFASSPPLRVRRCAVSRRPHNVTSLRYCTHSWAIVDVAPRA